MSEARAALISHLREAHRGRAGQRGAASADVPKDAPAPAAAFDFSTLPRYQAMTLHRAAADMLGMTSPFFRLHDGPPEPELAIDGAPRLNFASYNYLGLNGHPEVVAAAAEAMRTQGISACASRLVGGERPGHRALEAALAAVHGAESALAFVSGHATNVTTLATLVDREDLVLMDQLSHNSIGEGAKLSGSHRLVFPHNDYDWLDERLGQVRGQHRNVLIAVEGLYSMDGDSPDLARLVEIKDRHGAWLMVDEAHGLGVLGPTGRGIAEAQGIDPRRVEIWMGTLSKTLGACGGYIAGSQALIDILRFNAPGFVYSVGLAAPLAAAAAKALEIMLREPERVARLRANGQHFLAAARAAGLDTGHAQGTAVTPVILGHSMRAALASHLLHEAGISALPIIYPAVPEKLARLRFFVTSEHVPSQIDHAVATLARLIPEVDARLAALRG
ncbi:aminotransferase class I/II-fold pyridoxal phosphate-dependent enzyme [Limibaculum sp. FT325]|uniref:aminotransferase class I/II-fold pyridoxal phosphate-dependent enzyme n=1 Tax=Thermohalobaculum sediminis TaxID=2939436 RepID=UPI0020BE848C|nr:aminotransferase class I/II-fold pyridoxal phosphate-dependent enzyme [Limibaculum sediminis]MCL5777705.1 aminotransferase class I/II-fold pyridoxal phosphate-dependent enzyme [Limibaculum sediminis]